ncbi:MAG: PEP-CTERM sorting domain-containing protein [Acidobacteria bacterium]|nr:PEP-CTERM sorting domain-containing protein [Acidobacteriota bacterium]
MKRQSVSNLLLGAAMLFALSTPGYGIQFDLNCVLSNTACTPFPQSFGTVTITDIGGNTGVNVTVTTALGGKYKDLYLNLDPSLVSGITLTSPAIASSNGFSLAPYNGLFDVGTNLNPSAGFDGNSGVTFQILGNVSAINFNALDSLGLVGLAIHLQEIICTTTSCTSGGNSIKVGGTFVPGPPGGDDPGVPEPATYAIVGAGLAALGWLRRKRL